MSKIFPNLAEYEGNDKSEVNAAIEYLESLFLNFSTPRNLLSELLLIMFDSSERKIKNSFNSLIQEFASDKKNASELNKLASKNTLRLIAINFEYNKDCLLIAYRKSMNRCTWSTLIIAAYMLLLDWGKGTEASGHPIVSPAFILVSDIVVVTFLLALVVYVFQITSRCTRLMSAYTKCLLLLDLAQLSL